MPSGPAPTVKWIKGTPIVPTATSGKAVSVTDPKKPVRADVKETEIGATQGKPNLLYFYWPNPEDPAGKGCAKLDTEIWIDGKVAELSQKFVCIKVNGKTCPKQVLTIFGVKSYPTIVFQTSNKKIVTRVKSKCVAAKVFAKAMQSVLKTNDRVVKAAKAQLIKLDKMVESAGKLLAKGKLSAAEKAFKRLIKDNPDTDQASIAYSGLEEIKCRRWLAKGEKALKANKYAEAKSLLGLAASCEVPCLAKSRAEELLPDCTFGALYTDACKKLEAGKNAEAMEAFTKIAGDGCYEGEFKALAKKKLADMKKAWEKSTRS